MTADLRNQLQQSLGNTYTLERELGGGGMSRVFTAQETALGRSVVVKVLPPELAASVSTERFKREIGVAARLQHPHIVPLIAAGETGGLPYFTMPFVEGESLRARLARRGEMPVSETVRILREIASALAYAHEHGVIHRDIKPDNVLFTGDVAMVADFGVSKAIDAAARGVDRPERGSARDPSIAGMTSIGVALGTPAYMAPEQGTADPTTDHRADIYAFGVMAYEMLTGQPPFSGRNPSQLVAAHITEVPEPVTRRRPNIPPILAALVMRCLEKRPADRPQTATEVIHALDDVTTPSGGMAPTSASLPAVPLPNVSAAIDRRTLRRDMRTNVMVMAIVLLVLGIGGVAVWRNGAASARASTSDTLSRRIAVLPFENVGDSADAYFASGITDAVRGKLTGLANMEVIARASSNQYRGTTKSPADIARELGVRYLLTGTVRWAKSPNGTSHVQVSPELVEIASDGAASSKWQQPFDAEMADVFRVQGEIAGKVAEAMSVAVGRTDQARLVEVPTRNPAAYDAFLRAEALYWNGGNAPVDVRRALAEYERAVQIDSGFAEAWAGVARARSLIYAMSTPTPALARQTREAADRALQLAPSAAFAHVALATYHLNVDYDAVRGLKEVQAARTVTPNDPDILSRLALAYMSLGQFDEALANARMAQQLDPRSATLASRLRTVMFFLRRYPEARTAADRALALSRNVTNVQGRVLVALGEGNLADARGVLADAAKNLSEDRLVAYMAAYNDVGWALDDAGQRRALALGPEFFDDDRAGWAIARAHGYSWLGDSGLARAWGDTAAREFTLQARAAPNDTQRHILLAVSHAYAGRRAEALAAAKRGAELASAEHDYAGADYYDRQLARMYLLLGDRDKALDLLEGLLARPSYISQGWLRVEPTWRSLKGNPRFEKLIAGGKSAP